MPYYYYGFDPTYVLVLIGAVICLIASARVKSTFNKYSRYRSMSGMTGAQAAEPNEKHKIPRLISIAPVERLKNRPIRINGHASVDPMFATGTIAVRSVSGT